MNFWIAVEDACDRTRKRWYARRTATLQLPHRRRRRQRSVMTSCESAFSVWMQKALKTVEKPVLDEGETGSRKKNVRVHI
jgi:hypothetical protein